MFGTIKNRDQLIANGVSVADREARRLAIEILEAGLNAGDPRRAVERAVSIEGENLFVKDKVYDLEEVDNLYVVGAGKATGVMAEAVEGILKGRISAGCINVLRGTTELFNVRDIRITEASHPLPDESSIRGAKDILHLVSKAGERDLVLVLISGGTSTLMALPSKGLSLEDKQLASQLLLRSGASIDEVNMVRKHLSGVKGGQLGRAIYPARCIGLILSDVVGDDISTIGSGPTVSDSSTYADALDVLEQYDLVNTLPRIAQHLEKGKNGLIPETPKHNDETLTITDNFIIGKNEMALNEMAKRAGKLGLKARVIDTEMVGEAKERGRLFAEEINRLSDSSEGATVLLQGGETTVAVKGDGRGGRNQEFALGALLSLKKHDGIAVASMGTDGVDGQSDAAGAIVDGNSLGRGKDMGLDVQEYLKANDSNKYCFLLKECIITGPTGTNINDIVVGVVT